MNVNIKDKLRILRITKGLTQEDVANQINISRTAYAKYETGASLPPVETLLEIAKFFNISIDVILDHTVKNFLQLSWKQGEKAGKEAANELKRKRVRKPKDKIIK